MIQVYTGGGKGKTTAAWGQALRAAGQGMSIAVVRFLKPGQSGETAAASDCGLSIRVFGHTRPYDVGADQRESPEVRDDSRANFELAESLLGSGEYGMLVLDEINVVLHYGFVSRGEMEEFLSSISGVEVVLTGRYAPGWLLDAADLVTEMREIKHPSAVGAAARKGIEY